MKQNSFDAQQLYKEYMQTVNADPAAIEDILSGERQPVNHGARIKHSTCKIATVTAAAAVVAVCAGIGLSNMNANDDSSKVKSAASTVQTTTPAVTTAAQTTKEQAPAPTKQEAKFKTELVEMHASDHSLRVALKMSALNDEAKKMLREKGTTFGVNTLNSKPWKKGFDLASFTEAVITEDTYTTTLFFQALNSSDVLNDGEKFDIAVGTGESYQSVPTLTVKKNLTERVFKSANGKTLWLHDYGFTCDMDSKSMDKKTYENFEMTFSDRSVKTAQNMKTLEKRGALTEDPCITFSLDKFDSSKVTSIKYAGETFTPQ